MGTWTNHHYNLATMRLKLLLCLFIVASVPLLTVGIVMEDIRLIILALVQWFMVGNCIIAYGYLYCCKYWLVNYGKNRKTVKMTIAYSDGDGAFGSVLVGSSLGAALSGLALWVVLSAVFGSGVSIMGIP